MVPKWILEKSLRYPSLDDLIIFTIVVTTVGVIVGGFGSLIWADHTRTVDTYTCLANGYPTAKTAYFHDTYCIRKINNTDEVVNIRQLTKGK